MSKLFSCFGKSKNKRRYSDITPEENVIISGGYSKENNPVVFVVNEADNRPKFIGNVRHVYRTENNNGNSQFERVYGLDANRQIRSYPVSPERRSLYKVYSFEQRPWIEKLRPINRKDSRDSRSLTLYPANVAPIVPRFGRALGNSNESFPSGKVNNVPKRLPLSQGVDHLQEEPRFVAEKSADEYHEIPNVQSDLPTAKDSDINKPEIEKLSGLSSKVDNENISPRSSNIDKFVYLAKDKTVRHKVKVMPGSSKNFALGNSVKTMIYHADDNQRSPLSAHKYVRQMPIKAKKQPPLLTTVDGKILRPLTAENVHRTTTPLKGGQPIRLSVVRPVEAVAGFPLAQGGEVLLAAPMIGGGGGIKRGGKQQKSKSILRKGRGGGGGGGGGSPAQYGGGSQGYDDYMYEGEYGRGNYRQPYYDSLSDMYPYSPPMEDPYSYGRRGGGGYYDDGYGYADDGYGHDPGFGRGMRQSRQPVYVAQMPDITLPTTSQDTGKNPPFKKIGKPVDVQETCIDKNYYSLKGEKMDIKHQLPKEHKVKMVSSAQQTDLTSELDFICFSPEKCSKTTEAPNDPNSKLRWRIIIKRGDEE